MNYPMTDEAYPRCGWRIEVCKWVGPIRRVGFDQIHPRRAASRPQILVFVARVKMV